MNIKYNKKKILLLGIGVAMLLLAFGFVLLALNNPQLSFPWSNAFSYSLYIIYILIMLSCFFKALRIK